MIKNERFSRGNLIFLFVVAFLVGVIIKNAAANNIRIGFDDPNTIVANGKLYNIDELEQKLLRKGIPKEISTTKEPIEEIK